jgi:hypothetical protein
VQRGSLRVSGPKNHAKYVPNWSDLRLNPPGLSRKSFWESPHVRGGSGGQAHKYESSGISARAWLNMSAVPNRVTKVKQRKRHHLLYNENVDGGCARADSEGTNNEGKNRSKS